MEKNTTNGIGLKASGIAGVATVLTAGAAYLLWKNREGIMSVIQKTGVDLKERAESFKEKAEGALKDVTGPLMGHNAAKEATTHRFPGSRNDSEFNKNKSAAV